MIELQFLHMKLLFIYIVIVSCFLSCTKINVSEIERERIMLAGVGNPGDVFHTWVLDSAVLNGSPVALSSFQKQYKKIFFFSRTYKDSDLNEGKWDITEIKKLKQYIYIKSNIDSITYDILNINAFNLTIKATKGNDNLVYYFEITN